MRHRPALIFAWIAAGRIGLTGPTAQCPVVAEPRIGWVKVITLGKGFPSSWAQEQGPDVCGQFRTTRWDLELFKGEASESNLQRSSSSSAGGRPDLWL